MHIIILEEEELTRKATVRNFRTVQMEGLREREVEHYNLDMIIALGIASVSSSLQAAYD